MACCTPKVIICFAILCVCLLIVSLVLALKVFPDVIENEVNKATRLDNGTDQFDRFEELPFPIDFKVYLFNVENPQDILDSDTKPILTEVGPFVYQQYRKKTIYDYNTKDDTLTYTQVETFFFNESLSNGLSDSDEITTLNPVKMSLTQIGESILPGLVPSLIEECIDTIFDATTKNSFITAKVSDLLLDGVNFCPSMKLVDFPDDKKHCFIVQATVCAMAAQKKNVARQGDNSLSFSYFGYKNNQNDKPYTIKRGIKDITKLGHIVKWNDVTYTDFWGDKTTCDEVKGTDSTLYPPRVKKDESFFIFSTDICRYVQIDYTREGSYKGIDGYMFGVNNMTLKSSTDNPEDDCYCSKLTKGLDGQPSCFLDGAVDMYSCTKVPVIFTFPHFLWAENYIDGVEGMQPDENKHNIFLLVEPNTGSPLQGSKKIQLNAVFRKVDGIADLSNVKTGRLFPLLWIDEGISLNDEMIDMLNDLYFSKIKLVDGIKWTLIAVTAAGSVILCGCYIYKKRKIASSTKTKKENNEGQNGRETASEIKE